MKTECPNCSGTGFIEASKGMLLLKELIQIVNPKEKPTQDRVRLVNARLKEYEREEIVAAATAFSKSEWHKENKQMSVDNLLRPSKFGRWYAQSQEPDKKRFV